MRSRLVEASWTVIAQPCIIVRLVCIAIQMTSGQVARCTVFNNVCSARLSFPRLCVYDFTTLTTAIRRLLCPQFTRSSIHELNHKRQINRRSGKSVIRSGLCNVGRSVYQYWLSCPSACRSSWRSHIPSLDSEACCHVHMSPHLL